MSFIRGHHFSLLKILVFLNFSFYMPILYGDNSQKNISLSTDGNQSPAIISEGNVTVNYGIPQKVYEILLKELDDKDIALDERDKKIEELTKKYNELKSGFYRRAKDDEFATKASEMLAEGNLDGAEEILLASLKKRKHEVSETYYELASLKILKLEYREANSFYQKAVDIEPDNSKYLSEYGRTLLEVGQLDNAITILTKAVSITPKSSDINADELSITYQKLAFTLGVKGRFSESLDYYDKALNLCLKSRCNNKLTLSALYSEIAGAWNNSGNLEKAMEFSDKAINLLLNIKNLDHPLVAVVYNNHASILISQKNYEKALFYLKKGLNINLKVLADNHPKITMLHMNIGSCLIYLSQYDKALNHLYEALEITLKDTAPETKLAIQSNIYSLIGAALYAKKDNEKALDNFTKALELGKKFYGENHHIIAQIYGNMSLAENSLGHYKVAIEYAQKSHHIFNISVGPSHPYTIQAYTKFLILNFVYAIPKVLLLTILFVWFFIRLNTDFRETDNRHN